jgi:HD-GYP domain-containing protein (c-di-GMP phosphodiesterase class II)
MILGEDIYGHDALVLISRGKTLDEKLIDFLKSRYAPGEQIAIYYENKKEFIKPTYHSPEKKEKIPSYIKKHFDLSLEETQELITEFFGNDKNYRQTKTLIHNLKNDVRESFNFLLSQNEIEDKKFIAIAHKVLESMNLDKSNPEINPGYLYLIELENWHPDTFNHSIDVAFFTLLIASQLTNHKGELTSLFLGGLLHDIGKYVHYKRGDARFYDIITKIGPLTDEEFEILKNHVDVKDFFKDKFLTLSQKEQENIMYAALEHHEKMDGKGYLKGSKGLQISFAARIVAVADIYDALVRKRDYKSMVKPDLAMRHVVALGEEGKLDKTFTHIFRNIIGMYPTGTMVDTSHGPAMITGQTQDPYRPKILLIEQKDQGEINLTRHHDIDIYEEIID